MKALSKQPVKAVPISDQPVVIVTGGGRGIGKATCIKAASSGFTVIVNYRANTVAAESVVRQIQAMGGRAKAIRADISSEASVRRMFKTAERAFGPVSALVNNAGAVDKRCEGKDIDSNRFDRAIATNLRGPFLCMREAALAMHRTAHQRKSGGVIVNVSSYSVETGGAFNHIDYAAAKAGVEAMTVGFARELAGTDIRVNAVAPGTIDTDLSAGIVGAARSKIEKRIPMGRLGTPDEVAECIVWLLSPSSSYITGAVVPVNGGR
jgi:NAD(P)-dependent dehydrogenase (short-subunit alcohol dehydrogenase family)